MNKQANIVVNAQISLNSAVKAGDTVQITVGTGTPIEHIVSEAEAAAHQITQAVTIPSVQDGKAEVKAKVTATAAGNAVPEVEHKDDVTIDTGVPTVIITAGPDQTPNDGADTLLRKGQSTKITFTFSEKVNDFTMEDIEVSGGVLSDFVTSDGITYTATFTPTDNVNKGLATVSVASGKYHDAAKNAGLSGSGSFNYDTKVPNTPKLTSSDGDVFIVLPEDAQNGDTVKVKIPKDSGIFEEVTLTKGSTGWTVTSGAGKGLSVTGANEAKINYQDVSDYNSTRPGVGGRKVLAQAFDKAGNSSIEVDVKATANPIKSKLIITSISDDTGTQGDWITETALQKKISGIIEGSELSADQKIEIKFNGATNWQDVKMAGKYAWYIENLTLNRGDNKLEARIVNADGAIVRTEQNIELIVIPPKITSVTIHDNVNEANTNGNTVYTGDVTGRNSNDATLTVQIQLDKALSADQGLVLERTDGKTIIIIPNDKLIKSSDGLTYTLQDTLPETQSTGSKYTYTAKVLDLGHIDNSQAGAFTFDTVAQFGSVVKEIIRNGTNLEIIGGLASTNSLVNQYTVEEGAIFWDKKNTGRFNPEDGDILKPVNPDGSWRLSFDNASGQGLDKDTYKDPNYGDNDGDSTVRDDYISLRFVDKAGNISDKNNQLFIFNRKDYTNGGIYAYDRYDAPKGATTSMHDKKYYDTDNDGITNFATIFDYGNGITASDLYGKPSSIGTNLSSNNGWAEIKTGAGDDFVTIGKLEAWSRSSSNGKSVDLGDGNDTLWIKDAFVNGHTLDGGTGYDHLYLSGAKTVYLGASGNDTIQGFEHIHLGSGVQWLKNVTPQELERQGILELWITSPGADTNDWVQLGKGWTVAGTKTTGTLEPLPDNTGLQEYENTFNVYHSGAYYVYIDKNIGIY